MVKPCDPQKAEIMQLRGAVEAWREQFKTQAKRIEALAKLLYEAGKKIHSEYCGDKCITLCNRIEAAMDKEE